MSTPEAGFDLMVVNDGAGTDPNRAISFFFGSSASAGMQASRSSARSSPMIRFVKRDSSF